MKNDSLFDDFYLVVDFAYCILVSRANLLDLKDFLDLSVANDLFLSYKVFILSPMVLGGASSLLILAVPKLSIMAGIGSLSSFNLLYF